MSVVAGTALVVSKWIKSRRKRRERLIKNGSTLLLLVWEPREEDVESLVGFVEAESGFYWNSFYFHKNNKVSIESARNWFI
jgi:hypothetical protein